MSVCMTKSNKFEHLKAIPLTLAEFRHNRIVQSPHENYLTYVSNIKKSEVS